MELNIHVIERAVAVAHWTSIVVCFALPWALHRKAETLARLGVRALLVDISFYLLLIGYCVATAEHAYNHWLPMGVQHTQPAVFLPLCVTLWVLFPALFGLGVRRLDGVLGKLQYLTFPLCLGIFPSLYYQGMQNNFVVPVVATFVLVMFWFAASKVIARSYLTWFTLAILFIPLAENLTFLVPDRAMHLLLHLSDTVSMTFAALFLYVGLVRAQEQPAYRPATALQPSARADSTL